MTSDPVASVVASQQRRRGKFVEKQRLESIIEQLDPAEELSERHEHEEAREVLLAAGEECSRAGIDSAFISWRLCVVFDGLEELELAFKYVQQALRRGPVRRGVPRFVWHHRR